MIKKWLVQNRKTHITNMGIHKQTVLLFKILYISVYVSDHDFTFIFTLTDKYKDKGLKLER